MEDFGIGVMTVAPPTFRLRRLTEMSQDIMGLPIEFVGNAHDCAAYAERNGFRWKHDKSFLFNGYFVNDIGDCLMPT